MSTSAQKKVIITGGCGFLGSITSLYLKEQGYTPLLLDNFSTSKKLEQYQKLMPGQVLEVDLKDYKATEHIFQNHGPIHAIFHFAAYALVPESVQKPWAYFNNNINSTLNIAECAVKFSVPYFVHSSSCAVYGIPSSVPISETAPMSALTPYGESKVISESILQQFTRWKHFQALNLRYFNPAGSAIGAGLGELHQPETHLLNPLFKYNLLLAHPCHFTRTGNNFTSSQFSGS